MEGLFLNFVPLGAEFFPLLFLGIGAICCESGFTPIYRSHPNLSQRKKPETEKEKLEKFTTLAEELKNLLHNFSTLEHYQKIRELQNRNENALEKIGHPVFRKIAEKTKLTLEDLYQTIRFDVSQKNTKTILEKIEEHSQNSKVYTNIEKLVIFKNEKIGRLYMVQTELACVKEIWEEKILKKFRDNTDSNYEDLIFRAKLMTDKNEIKKFQDYLSDLITIFAITHEEGSSIRDTLDENYRKISTIDLLRIPFYERQLKKIMERMTIIQSEELSGIDTINFEIERLEKAKEFYTKILSVYKAESERLKES